MPALTSIIVAPFDNQVIVRRMTYACLGNIAKYTDDEDYELIVVDQGSMTNIHDVYHMTDHVDKHLVVGDVGMSQAMNIGAKEATGKYICFMHNDVFVWEGWLRTMVGFLENPKYKYRIVMPHQGRTTREMMKKFEKEENPRGNDDAGLILMSKEDFDKTGGWDERFPNIYQDLAFRRRLIGPVCYTAKCVITHICGMTVWADEEIRKKNYAIEGARQAELYGPKK
jgi:GT2 family glycosyltransferase